MSSAGSITAPDVAAESGTSLLDADVARELLFDKILDQLAASSLFSNPDCAPNIFIVYAHDNVKEGTAYDECVRKFIKWLRQIHARILSDQTPLPHLNKRIEGDDAIRNILANQLCLLPPQLDSAGTPSVTSVDKVIVCGSVVLERYYREPSALSYIADIVRICTTSVDQSASGLQASIRARVETETNEDGFHHILTELAFLEVRKSVLSERHGMIPLALSQSNAVGAPMQYLPAFYNTDVKLKLGSPEAGSLHKLFFKLLEQLFPDDRDFIKYFRDCYNSAGSKLWRGQNKSGLSRKEFDEIVSQQISRAFREYWSLFCVSVRDGKLQAYSGKLSDQVSKVLKRTELTEQHKILKWLSPISAPELHGRFKDSGTARIEGTCDWVIKDENFGRWFASQDSALLLLRGDMGTGKTYSTSRVVDWIKQGLSTNTNHEAFAYFYCNKQDSMRRQAKEILRNIVRQLATGPWRDSGKSDAIHETVHELWETSQGRGISSTFAQWSSCLVSLIETYPRTTIVLDAFDECETAQRQDLIKLFIGLATRHLEKSSVKLFISTRPEQDILQHFDKYPTIRLGGKQNADDIATFVRTKIAEHRRWSKMPEEFQSKVIQTLLAKSGNMFLFASLQIQHLLLCTTQPALEDRLGKIPDSLEETYQEIYQKAAPHHDERILLDRALKWVMCSSRPLNSDELSLAICQDSESDRVVGRRPDVNEDLILALSQNLLCLGDGTDDRLDNFISGHTNIPYLKASSAPVWRLAHQAVGEFFENTMHCNFDVGHYEVGRVCLTLLLDTFRRDEENYMILCVENSLVVYAIWAWPTHVRTQEHREARRLAGITQNLRKFLGEPEKGSPTYEKWMKYVSAFYGPMIPYWSILGPRSVPNLANGTGIMNPISLACYLGFYNTLAEWWHGYRFDENAGYSAVDWYPPAITYFRAGPPFYFFDQIPTGSLQLRWSLSALACANDETEILKCLLIRGALINTEGEDEVPPIVVTAMTNSVGSAAELLRSGTELHSSFTRMYGDALHLAIRQDSLDVMELLLSRAFAEPLEIESSLSRFSWQIESFRSPESIILLLDRGVNVNTPLFDGTLLAAAAWGGWEHLVRQLLTRGADVNTKFEGLSLEDAPNYKTALEAAVSSYVPSTIPWLLIEHGARVTAGVIDSVLKMRPDAERIRQLLKMHEPDRTWKDEEGNNTSALIEQVKDGHTNEAYLLIQDGADVKLNVGGKYGNPISTMFWAALHHSRYPLRTMIDLFVDAGVLTFGFLEADHLNIALASVAYHGLEDRVQYFLDLGASPDTVSAHRWTTALGAAAASGHPRASRVIRTLLVRGATVNIRFPSSIDGLDEHSHHKFALDCPAFLLLLYAFIGVPTRSKRMHSWLQSASVLLSNGAIWDIDFTQWRECLAQRAPEFAGRYSQSLDQMQQMFQSNRATFFLTTPGAASDESWQIKDAKDPSGEPRNVLDEMGRVFTE